MRLSTSARVALIALVAAVTPLLTVGGAEAGSDHERSRPRLTVTQNLYLGSPLTPALDPSVDTREEFVTAVAQIYGTALATDFPTRAEAIADTVAKQQPDLVGLQEVTDWVAAPTHSGATPPSQDFLQILVAALEARGLDYDVAAVGVNADIGPVPLVAPQYKCGVTAADCVVSLKDRDVILVNETTHGLRGGEPAWGGTTHSRRSPLRTVRRCPSTVAGSRSRPSTGESGSDSPIRPRGLRLRNRARGRGA